VRGGKPVRLATMYGPGPIGFSPDGRTLHLGLHDVDVAAGTLGNRPAPPDLAAWAAGAGLPAPPTLSVGAARASDDGSLVVVAATGVTRDRRHGLQKPKQGDVDWLIALDGATRQPRAALWHGRGELTEIAISDRHIAAGGPVRVFERAAGATEIRPGGHLPTVIGLAWAPGGELLGAIGDAKTIALWRTGEWTQPSALWRVGNDYQRGVAFHPTRPVIAVGNRDGHVRFYGVGAAQLASPPLVLDHDAGGGVTALAFSPDGKHLVVATTQPASRITRLAVSLTP
jgi:WD40 repeat protein